MIFKTVNLVSSFTIICASLISTSVFASDIDRECETADGWSAGTPYQIVEYRVGLVSSTGAFTSNKSIVANSAYDPSKNTAEGLVPFSIKNLAERSIQLTAAGSGVASSHIDLGVEFDNNSKYQILVILQPRDWFFDETKHFGFEFKDPSTSNTHACGYENILNGKAISFFFNPKGRSNVEHEFNLKLKAKTLDTRQGPNGQIVRIETPFTIDPKIYDD